MISVAGHSEPVDARLKIRTLKDAVFYFFSYPAPKLILLFFLAPLGARIVLGGPYTFWDLGIVLAIAFFWPLQEWWAHKYVLHLKPFSLAGRKIDPTFARVHREHHRRPWNIETTFLPWRVVIGAFVVSVGLWLIATPTLRLALTGIAAYSFAALLYEWTHYLTHTPYKPKSKYYAKILKGHRLHHFKNEHFWYGFTVPLVDALLKTDPDHKDVETSDTCLTLGVAGESDSDITDP